MTITTELIFGVGIMIFSLAFIFMATILLPNKVTKEKLEKILGQKAIEEIKKVQNEEEKIVEIIRNLSKKQKAKLKTLLESQDVRDVIQAIKEHILKGEK